MATNTPPESILIKPNKNELLYREMTP